jgi:hypothetical protein
MNQVIEHQMETVLLRFSWRLLACGRRCAGLAVGVVSGDAILGTHQAFRVEIGPAHVGVDGALVADEFPLAIGRKPIEAERRQNVLKLAAEGATRAVIVTQLGIGEATVYRILATQKALSH